MTKQYVGVSHNHILKGDITPVGKKVILTRKHEGMEIKEVCTLMADDEPVMKVTSENALILISEDGDWGTAGSMAEGRVMFEDDTGVFGIEPEDVVHIEVLDGPLGEEEE